MAATNDKTANSATAPYRTWLGVVALLVLLALSALLIRKADGTKTKDWNEDRFTYLPSGKILKPMVMDLDEAAADILWIWGMLYFSDAYLQGNGYQWLGHVLDIVTTLNPHFHTAYEFGGTVLTREKSQVPKTLKLLDRGIGVFPGDWKLRLFAATAQLQLDSNFTKAAAYLEPIALDTAVPAHIRTMSATLLNKGGGRHMALAFLVNRYSRSANAIGREIFLEKILKLYPETGYAAGSPGSKEGRMIVEKILREVAAEPMSENTALRVIDEFLRGGEISRPTRALLDLLR